MWILLTPTSRKNDVDDNFKYVYVVKTNVDVKIYVYVVRKYIVNTCVWCVCVMRVRVRVYSCLTMSP